MLLEAESFIRSPPRLALNSWPSSWLYLPSDRIISMSHSEWQLLPFWNIKYKDRYSQAQRTRFQVLLTSLHNNLLAHFSIWRQCSISAWYNIFKLNDKWYYRYLSLKTILFIYLSWGVACAMTYMWVERIACRIGSLHCVGPGDGTEVIRLGCRHCYQLNHLATSKLCTWSTDVIILVTVCMHFVYSQVDTCVLCV